MRFLWLLVISTMLLTSSARAQSAPAPAAARAPAAPAPDAPTTSHEVETQVSYRWQIAVTDAAAITIALSGKVRVAGVIYLLDGMVIHSLHGRGGRATASLVLRAGLPVLGAVAGGWLWWRSQDSRCRAGDHDFCSDDEINSGALLGFGLGLATAAIVDSALIARSVTVRKPKAAAWTPRLSVTPERIALGFAARF